MKPMVASFRTKEDAKAARKRAVAGDLDGWTVIRVKSEVRRVARRWEFDIEVES